MKHVTTRCADGVAVLACATPLHASASLRHELVEALDRAVEDAAFARS